MDILRGYVRRVIDDGMRRDLLHLRSDVGSGDGARCEPGHARRGDGSSDRLQGCAGLAPGKRSENPAGDTCQR